MPDRRCLLTAVTLYILQDVARPWNSSNFPIEIHFYAAALLGNLHIQQAVNNMLSHSFGRTIRNPPRWRNNVHFTLFEQTSHQVRSNLNWAPTCAHDRLSIHLSPVAVMDIVIRGTPEHLTADVQGLSKFSSTLLHYFVRFPLLIFVYI